MGRGSCSGLRRSNRTQHDATGTDTVTVARTLVATTTDWATVTDTVTAAISQMSGWRDITITVRDRQPRIQTVDRRATIQAHDRRT